MKTRERNMTARIRQPEEKGLTASRRKKASRKDYQLKTPDKRT
jgi:hypothetical protein